jgi:hypothetical protein
VAQAGHECLQREILAGRLAHHGRRHRRANGGGRRRGCGRARLDHQARKRVDNLDVLANQRAGRAVVEQHLAGSLLARQHSRQVGLKVVGGRDVSGDRVHGRCKAGLLGGTHVRGNLHDRRRRLGSQRSAQLSSQAQAILLDVRRGQAILGCVDELAHRHVGVLSNDGLDGGVHNAALGLVHHDRVLAGRQLGIHRHESARSGNRRSRRHAVVAHRRVVVTADLAAPRAAVAVMAAVTTRLRMMARLDVVVDEWLGRVLSNALAGLGNALHGGGRVNPAHGNNDSVSSPANASLHLRAHIAELGVERNQTCRHVLSGV